MVGLGRVVLNKRELVIALELPGKGISGHHAALPLRSAQSRGASRDIPDMKFPGEMVEQGARVATNRQSKEAQATEGCCSDARARQSLGRLCSIVPGVRGLSSVLEALPHSEGIAYKPPCGEIAVCPRVGRMGSIK